MPRPSTGAVVEHTGRDGRTYRSLRFTAYGKRRFVSLGPVSAQEAARMLRHTLADVERGVWMPPQAVQPPPEPDPMPTFHQFAEQWWVRNEAQLQPKTRSDYRWRLEKHLLPFFAEYTLDAITFDLVERYITEKLSGDKPLSPRSVNMTLTLMAAILEGAVERQLIARNPARGRKRRVREREPRRTYLDNAEQVAALLAAAGELDREAREGCQHIERRAILATLIFAGLRIGELRRLRWRDVDLASGWLHVSDAKTDAGRRRVKLRGALRDELLAVRSRHAAASDAFVFATARGGEPSANNLRRRVLAPAVKRANANLATRDLPPLPALTPHSLRRTFASLLYALGEDPGIVMDEMGHTHPGLALRIYRQSMRREQGEKDRLRALVEGDVLADIGRQAARSPADSRPEGTTELQESVH
jgi:integrase